MSRAEPTEHAPREGAPRGAPPRARRVQASRVVAVLLFLTCFLASSLFGARFDRLRDLDRLGKTMEYLKQEGAAYDVVFFGSSRFMRGLDPTLVDRRMAALGVEVNSYNVSAPAAASYEISGLIRRMYSETPARPRWVVIELWEPDPTLRRDNLWKPRTVYWHTPFMTWAAARDSLEWTRIGWKERVALAWLHVRHLLQDQLGIGRGSLILSSRLPGHGRETGSYLARNKGYLPYLERVPDPGSRRASFLKQFEHFQKALPKLVAANAREVEPRTAFRRNLRAEIELLRSRGAEPIYVVMPSDTRPSAPQRSLDREGAVPTLLAYDSPDRYPRMYELDLRWDVWHLNADGAQHFTRVLATDLAAHIASRAAEAR